MWRWGASVSALACVLFWSDVAQAQFASIPPPPVASSVDNNGIDLINSSYTGAFGSVSIGDPANGGLSRSGTFSVIIPPSMYGLDQYTGSINSSNVAGTLYTVSIGSASEIFIYNAGVYTPAAGSPSTLAFSNGVYTYVMGDGTVAHFSTALAGSAPVQANVARITDLTRPDQQALNFYYQLLTTNYSASPGVTIPVQRLSAVINNHGYELKYNYQSDTDTIGSVSLANIIALNNRVDYCNPTEDGCSGLTQAWPTVTFSGNSVTDPVGRTTTITTSADKHTSTITDPAGVVTAISFDSSYNVTSVARGGQTWAYSYWEGTPDYAGAPVPKTGTVTNPLGNSITVASIVGATNSYVTSYTDGLGRVTNYQTDGFGRVTQVTYPAGNGVGYTYDARSNITSITQIPIPNTGLSSYVSLTANYDATCSSAKCNEPNWIKDAAGNETDYTYNATIGVLTSVTQPAQANGVRPQTNYSYSYLSAGYLGAPNNVGPGMYLLTGVTTCNTTASCVNSADETVTTTTYASGQNLAPTSVTTAAGDNSLSSTISSSYDFFGNLYTTTNAVGATTRYRYDADQELVGLVGPDPDGGGPLIPTATRFSYNADGQVTLKELGTVPSQSDGDWGGFNSYNQIATAYDGVGRPVQTTTSGGGTAYGVTQYSYDAANRLTCSVVRMNPAAFGSLPGSACSLGAQGSVGPDRISYRTYDAADEVTQVTSAYGAPGQRNDMSVVSFTPNGHVLVVADANGNRTTFNRDGLDRLANVQYPTASNGSVSNPNDSDVYVYDAAGRVSVRGLRDGSSRSYSYDALGRVLSDGISSYGYDNQGRVTSANASGYAYNINYTALGWKNCESNSYGGSVCYGYDGAGEVTRLTWQDGFYASYSYDLNGHVKAISDSAGNAVASYGYDSLGRTSSISYGGGAAGASYSYDGLSRPNLIGLTYVDPSQNTTIGLAYSPAGQLISRTFSNDLYDWATSFDVTQNYGINGLNQISSVGANAYGYDAKGNLTSDGTNSYSYSQDSKLTGMNATSLSYDGLRRLVNVSSPSSGQTQFTYAGSSISEELSSGGVLRRYIPGPDGAVAWYEGAGASDRRALVPDNQGSVIAVANASGVLAINGYDPYGLPSGANLGRIQYAGRPYIPEVGLYDTMARSYSPTLGRFLQTDPIGYADGLNWYAYTHNDPVNGMDPTGLDTELSGVTVTGVLGPDSGEGGGAASGPSSGGMVGTHAANYPVVQGPELREVVVTGHRRRRIPWGTIAVVVVGVAADVLIPEVAIPAEILAEGAEIEGEGALLSEACFAPGTLVLTKNGPVAIEKIKLGDMILSRDPMSGVTAYKRVIGVKVPSRHDVYRVTVDVTESHQNLHHHAWFNVTSEHPWREADGRWVATKNLHNGDELVSKFGKAVRVLTVSDRHREVQTYNLEVADYHTYFVGRDGVWVHNNCFPDPKEIAKRLGVSKDIFHNVVKKELINDLKVEMRSIGSSNPDIGVSAEGNILLRNPSTKAVVDTGVPMSSYSR